MCGEIIDPKLAQAIVGCLKSHNNIRSEQQLSAAVIGPWNDAQKIEAIEFLHDTNVIAYDDNDGWVIGTRSLGDV